MRHKKSKLPELPDMPGVPRNEEGRLVFPVLFAASELAAEIRT